MWFLGILIMTVIYDLMIAKVELCRKRIMSDDLEFYDGTSVQMYLITGRLVSLRFRSNVIAACSLLTLRCESIL